MWYGYIYDFINLSATVSFRFCDWYIMIVVNLEDLNSLNTKIGREVPKVNLPVIHDLNNGKLLQPKFFLSAKLCLGVTWSPGING